MAAGAHRLRGVAEAGFELRQLRTFIAVAERKSFTLAAGDLHIAQQAVSQQIRALEQAVGVTLLSRNSRNVSLTPAGAVFLDDCRSILAAAERANERVRAAARGELGSLRLAYTLASAWETAPTLLAHLPEVLPEVSVEAREVFGGDIEQLLERRAVDLALAPVNAYPKQFGKQEVRRERLRLAVGEDDSVASGERIELSALGDRRFEVWPREMAPGFYDAVVGACRGAGFEPALDERAGGNTVWGYIADGHGVGLINESIAEQLPRGIRLVDLADAAPVLATELVWHRDSLPPAAELACGAIRKLARERSWM